MVIHSPSPSSLYVSLQKLEQHPAYAGRLQFHNFVNNADIVPRLLGSALDSIHTFAESYVPLLKVRLLLAALKGLQASEVYPCR